MTFPRVAGTVYSLVTIPGFCTSPPPIFRKVFNNKGLLLKSLRIIDLPYQGPLKMVLGQLLWLVAETDTPFAAPIRLLFSCGRVLMSTIFL